MCNSNYSIGLQCLKPVHTAYGAICIPIRKLVLGRRRKWPRPRRLPPETETLTTFLETRHWYVSRPRPQTWPSYTTVNQSVGHLPDIPLGRLLRHERKLANPFPNHTSDPNTKLISLAGFCYDNTLTTKIICFLTLLAYTTLCLVLCTVPVTPYSSSCLLVYELFPLVIDDYRRR